MPARRLSALLAAAVILAGCGSSAKPSAGDRCRADAVRWTRQYVRALPNPVAQATIDRLTRTGEEGRPP